MAFINGIKRITWGVLICAVIGVLISVGVNAQESADSVSGTKPIIGLDGVVEIEGKRLFQIQTKFGPFSKQTRASNVVRKIDNLLDDSRFDPDKITIVESETTVDIIAGDVLIATITQPDAKAANKTQLELAELYVDRLKTVLPELKSKRTISGALEEVDVKKFGQNILGIFLEPTAIKFATTALGALFILGIATIVKRSLGRYIQDSTSRYNAKKIISFAGYCLCILFATVVFRDALGNLAVILGAATAGIAFALKEVIISIAGWVAVTFGDFYKVGDRVELGGIKGDVIDIGFGRTTLMELGEWVKGDLYTGRIVRVANSFVFKDPMFNYSRDFPFLWDEITVPVKFGSDYDRAVDILEKAVNDVCGEYVEEATSHWKHITKKYLVEHAQTEPMVTYFFNDNWVEYTARYVVNYKKRRTTKYNLHTRILKDFEANSKHLGLASATFHLVEAPMINVQVKEPPEKRKAVAK